jgi:hypothetical protein
MDDGMSGILYAVAATFGLGVVYYLAAIPAGTALGLPVWLAAVSAWAGYAAIAAAVLAAGAPLRAWLIRRLRINASPDPKKLFWRIWRRFGLAGLAIAAPVTCGPYIAALIGVALGERPGRLLAWIGAAAIPWSVLFAVLTALGFSFLPETP